METATYLIYKLSSATHPNLYVGSTTIDKKKSRLSQHKTAYNKYVRSKDTNDVCCSHKYYELVDDWNDVKFVIIETLVDATKQAAFEREQHYIELYDLVDFQKKTGTRAQNPQYLETYRKSSRKSYDNKIKGQSTKCECGGKINLMASKAVQKQHLSTIRHREWVNSHS